jgi:hypothetical protein
MNNKLENYIQENIGQLERKKPDPAILARILAEVQPKENNGNKTNKQGLIVLLRLAAACVIVTICLLGLRYLIREEPVKEIVKINKIPDNDSLVQHQMNATAHNIAKSRQKEDQIIPKNIAYKVKAKPIGWYSGLKNMESAATRIDAVFLASNVTGDNNAVIHTLMRVLNTDPNASVRLAAIDGLNKFYGDGYASSGLVASLKSQLDPVVQITLIALLVQKHELGVLPDLTRMVNDEMLEKSVKDFAYSSILQLRPEKIN